MIADHTAEAIPRWLRRIVGGLWLLSVSISLASIAAAQETRPQLSVVDRLSGFDADRIAAVSDWLQAPADSERLGEAAKLLFQVNRLARTSLAPPPAGPAPQDAPDLPLAVGDAVAIRGTAVALASAPLPAELAEVLELERIFRVEVRTSYPSAGAAPAPTAGPTIYVLTTSVPAPWLAQWAQMQRLDQPTAATGVVLHADAQGRPQVLAAPAMSWFPAAGSSADAPSLTRDWALLASQGFDVSLLGQVRSLHREPLLAADQQAFYGMLRAASRLAEEPTPAPLEADAAALLRDAEESIGRYVRLDCQSVRLTRIAITTPELQTAVGADHYWQLDAQGDLGNVVIQIESAEANAEPAMFHNRYPVSIVTLRLPDFLRQLVAADAAVEAHQSNVSLVSRQLRVEGFFYRLWSYDSDYMSQHGGGKQFGPLLMATRIVDIEPPPGDRAGVGRIGRVAAASVVVMLLATGIWMYVTGRQDAAARQRRLAQPETLAWPGDRERPVDTADRPRPPEVGSG